MTENKKPTVGYIGLGIMGKPAAANLLRAGYPLIVFARRPEQAASLISQGAQASATPADLARQCEFIFTNVSDTPDVKEILLGGNGVIHGAKEGAIVADMSTISPAATRQMAATLAEKKIELLDAPVSGGEKGAIEGALSFMVGGNAEAFARALPLFNAMGKTVTLVGESGAGQTAKACNQIVIGATIEGIAEAFRLAQKNGVDAARVRQALMGGFAASKVMEIHAARMLSGDYAPGFKAALHRKDMKIALENAEQFSAPLPGAEIFLHRLDKLIEGGGGDLDSSAVFKILQAEE